MARKLHAAVEDRDGLRLQRESRRFLDELAAHLAGEAHDLSSVPEASRSELAEGQHRLIQLAERLASEDPEQASLEGPAEGLLAMMQWQRDRERRALAVLPRSNPSAA